MAHRPQWTVIGGDLLVDAPMPGQALICCARPGTDVVLDL
jgi:hypothetical protein